MRLSRTIAAVPTPPIAKVGQWLKRYQNEFGLPIDLCKGAPSAPPCEQLKKALVNAALDPASAKYSDNFGTKSMREALANEMKVVYGHQTDVESTDVALTAGCNLAFYAAAQVVADKGDEIILPVPWMALQMLGIISVPLHLKPEDEFQPSVEACEALITPRTRAITLVTPNNPTGAIYSPSLLRAFSLLAQRHKLALIVDETYRDFITTGPPHSLFHPSEGWNWRDTVVHLFSFSKSYAIPGHRLGAIVAGESALKQVQTVLDTIQICPPTIPQVALQSILPSLRPLLSDTAQALSSRHTLFGKVMSSLAPRWLIGSQGGYFAFIRHPFEGKQANEVCEGLAAQVGIACLPGGNFATEKDGLITKDGEEFVQHWVRVAVANVNDDQLTEVARRLTAFEELSGWKLG
ncbi:hypothetical protein M407DRAFT_27707 [Tulasnella calospora MUT 4182]|uniref:Aminotransferase class I/classII large domain-containing protein n=1 Tax=Tulasnella calospora MUT 4182 TaxID=1051891 RepID=A0A0C3QDC7_9AGAM|nr:hypothetical protein M407DRAFT_27707 [Tulasnella calospora MUT 4182]